MLKKLNVLEVDDFNELGLAKVITSEDRHYWVNSSGNVFSELEAHVITKEESDEELYSLINKAGETVVPFGVYRNINFRIMENHDGTAFVAEKETPKGFLYGLIDDKGNEIVPFGHYDYIFQSGCLGLPENNNEEYILPHHIKQNTYIVDKGDKYGLINDKGEEVLLCTYEIKEDINNEPFAFFDNAPNILSQFAVPKKYKPKLFPVIGENRWIGYENKQNELIIPCEYFDAREFVNGFARVFDYAVINGGRKKICYHIDEEGKDLEYTIKYDGNGDIDPS